MIRQRFATRITTKRVFDFNLKDDDPQPIEKAVEEDSSGSLEINTPVIPDQVDSNVQEKVGNGEENFCTPNSPVCSEVLNEILKHPPLGTSTPRIAVPQNIPKQLTHYPKSLFKTTSSKLTCCSPIRKFAVIKPSSQNHSSPKKATATSKSVVNVPITVQSQKKAVSTSSAKAVQEQAVSSPVKEVQDVLESPKSPNSETSSPSTSLEVPIQNSPVQEPVSESPKKLGLRSPKVNKVAKLRPRTEISKEVPVQSAESQNEHTPSEPRVKHISLSKSAIKQISIDSESPFQETKTKNSPHKATSPKKSSQKHVSKTSEKASQSTKSAKTSKETKSRNKVPREVKLLMEQCYKMENLKSHYHADTGEVEFEQNTRSHKPISYNLNTMLAKFDKQIVPKKGTAKSKSDVYNFSGCTVGKKGKSKPKNPRKKTSQSKKNVQDDSGNSSSSFIIKRKKPATKVLSDDDDDENVFIQKKRKVSQDSDSGYCKDTDRSKNPKKKASAVRSKRSLYTKNYDDFDYDISPSTSTTSNDKHFVKSMKHLVKKTDISKVRKNSKKR